MYFNENHKEIVENRGDNYIYIGSYHRNEITIDDKNKSKNVNYIRVKCPYCGKEYDIVKSSFINRKDKCKYCCNSYEDSFAYYIQMELQEPLNKYWDWEKNNQLGINPYCIKSQSNKKVYIKCTETDYHGSYSIMVSNFHKGRRCSFCNKNKVHPKDSFAQWGINTFGEDFLEKYWSSKNTINPWEIKPQSDKKVWIYCQKHEYHNDNDGYEISCDNFHKGKRCGYCHNFKLHPLDSFGSLYPEKAKYWSPNNDKSPYEIFSHTKNIYKFICEKCGDEFERSLESLNSYDSGVICKQCGASKLEQQTKLKLDKYNIKYEREKSFNNLTGVGGQFLRFDFYLPDYNLLIECQGIQHKEWQEGWQTKEGFEKQLEHDKRKRRYCTINDIKLLEIWYYDIDNIERILLSELNLK